MGQGYARRCARVFWSPAGLSESGKSCLDFKMKVGALTATVSVPSTDPVPDSQTATVGTIVERAKVSQLPYNGRSFHQSLLFTPGVVPGVQGSELNNNRGGSINPKFP